MRIACNLSDLDLADRSQRGDREATEVLIERYRRFARARVRGYFVVGADADDVEQEALIGLCKAVRDFRPGHGASFRSFAELCINRQVLTAIKAASRAKHQPLNRAVPIVGARPDDPTDQLDLEPVSIDLDADPWRAFEAAERAAALRQLLDDQLSELEVEVLSLFAEGHTYQAIGARVGRPEKSVDNALQRIKRKLGPALAAA